MGKDSTQKTRSAKRESTQKTQPKKGEPIEIPIPTESQIERDFTKIATAKRDDEDAED